MPTETPRPLLEVRYYRAAQEYLRSLPLEHFMEPTSQATQRKITLESFDLIHAERPEVQVFNELLVQYPLPRQKRPGQVVPDNMVVIHAEPIKAEGSYDVPLQPVPPFLVLEYVSKSSQRKDYDDNMVKYERDLKVPYYLLFYPDTQDLSIYRHTGKKFVSVKVNEHDRLEMSKLNVEAAILDGWVRFWYRGELVPLPADLQRELDEKTRQLEDKSRQLEDKTRQLEESERARLAVDEENARLRAEIAQLRQRRTNHK
jgi:Uma2 family endonuclease